MTEDRGSPIASSAKASTKPESELETMRAEIAELREQLAECGRQAGEQARRHRLEEGQLQHRARNTVALIRSAFKQTIETGRSFEEIEMHFCARLEVLARYMLPHTGRWNATIDVQNVIREELRNFQFGHAPGITVDGPDVGISLEQAQSFALAIHELATNALKFGALSVKNAELSVTWALNRGSLKLVWAERDLPDAVSAPVLRGFGHTYIEDALPYQVDAITRIERERYGVACTIEMPLSERMPLSS